MTHCENCLSVEYRLYTWSLTANTKVLGSKQINSVISRHDYNIDAPRCVKLQHVPLFWQNTKEKAQRLGLVGWVRNTAEKTVAGKIQGPAEQIEQMWVGADTIAFLSILWTCTLLCIKLTLLMIVQKKQWYMHETWATACVCVCACTCVCVRDNLTWTVSFRSRLVVQANSDTGYLAISNRPVTALLCLLGIS